MSWPWEQKQSTKKQWHRRNIYLYLSSISIYLIYLFYTYLQIHIDRLYLSIDIYRYTYLSIDIYRYRQLQTYRYICFIFFNKYIFFSTNIYIYFFNKCIYVFNKYKYIYMLGTETKHRETMAQKIYIYILYFFNNMSPLSDFYQ